MLNFVIILIFLLPFGGGWQQIVSVMGDMYLLIYAASAVAVAVLRKRPDGGLLGFVPGLTWIAPLSFIVASEFVYWSGWHDLRLALPLVLIGLPLFLYVRREGRAQGSLKEELLSGAWLVVYLLLLTLLSRL
jgi:amino acid transporter